MIGMSFTKQIFLSASAYNAWTPGMKVMRVPSVICAASSREIKCGLFGVFSFVIVLSLLDICWVSGEFRFVAAIDAITHGHSAFVSSGGMRCGGTKLAEMRAFRLPPFHLGEGALAAVTTRWTYPAHPKTIRFEPIIFPGLALVPVYHILLQPRPGQ